MGAIDLNGLGFNTNAPGANAGDRDKAAIITQQFHCYCRTPWGLPAACGTPLYRQRPRRIESCCGPGGARGTGEYELCFIPESDARLHVVRSCSIPVLTTSMRYPAGTGGYPYGPTFNPPAGPDAWQAPPPTTPPPLIPGIVDGNPGTPLPGVNEMSSGFETLCRNSDGDVILTGRDFTEVGVLQDLVVGEFLDVIYHDTQSFAASDNFHVSIFDGSPALTPSGGSNLISDPPAPNPPPLSYWLGLPALDIVLDQSNLEQPAFIIEGEEIFDGGRAPLTGYIWLRPNPDNIFGQDEAVLPGFPVGPAAQSSPSFFTFSARQQIGNFLYATDVENRLLHAINSNTMRVLASISLPDPTGVGISPAGDLLYVSNFSNDSLSVVDTDPLSPTFHTEIARIPVGAGPRAVSVQPDNEDVFVANFLGDSVSIVDQQTLTVRKTIDALINGPFDIALSDRQLQLGQGHPFGFAAGIYFGYISNLDGNNVVVFESGPDGPQGIGVDNVLGELPTGDDDPAILRPRGLCFSPLFNDQGFAAGGCFVAHQDDEGFGRVSHILFANQAIFGTLPVAAPPGFLFPPGFLNRSFELTSTWGNSFNNRLAGRIPMDVTLPDKNIENYNPDIPSPGFANFGSPIFQPHKPEETGFTNSRYHMRMVPGGAFAVWQPDRVYVGFNDVDTIQVLDPNSAGVVLNTIEGEDGLGVKKLASYWHQ